MATQEHSCRQHATAAAMALPTEVLIHTLSFLNVVQLARAGAVCTAWYAASRSPSLWHEVALGRSSHSLRVTNDTVAHLLSLSVRLEKVDMECCRSVSGPGFAALAAAGTHLTRLNLNRTRVNDEQLATLAGGCPRLVSLELSNCSGIKGPGLDAVMRSCTELAYLDLGHNPQLRDDISNSLVLGSALQHVHLRACHHLTDVCVRTLANACKTLRYINLRECSRISDESIAALARGCPLLRRVDVRQCERVTPLAVERALPSWPELIYIKQHSLPSSMNSDTPWGRFTVVEHNGGWVLCASVIVGVSLSNRPSSPRPEWREFDS